MNWKTLYYQATFFQRIALWTLGVTFFLIFVGSLVRAAGAGLGCPDWPRCFGLWIPPLSAEALPPPYDPAEFNPVNTWLEYVNRLVGVTVGLFILATFLAAFRFWRSDRAVFAGAAAALVLVLFQGWLGGRVVRSGLEGWMISVHMVVALIILNVLAFTIYRSMRDVLSVNLPVGLRFRLLAVVGGLLAVTWMQIVLGSQVREAVAAVMAHDPPLPRQEWLGEVGAIDMVHRSFSWLVVVGSIFFFRAVRPLSPRSALRDLAALNNSVVVVQIGLGVGLAYAGLPPALQIFHLVCAALMTVVQALALWLVMDSPPT